MIKRRRGGRKLKRKMAEVKKEMGAVVSPLLMALVAVERVTAVGRCAAFGEEIKRQLKAEAAPCFVSDSTDRITWINAAFCKMVLCEESSSLSSPALRRMETKECKVCYATSRSRVIYLRRAHGMKTEC